jgi:integron integrase
MLGKQTKRQLHQPGELETALRRMIRSQGKAESTADCYWDWAVKFLKWVHHQRKAWVHPKDLGRDDVERYLSALANDRRVSSTTQNQAFSALCYLYRWVIRVPIENCSALRSKNPDGIREVVDESELVKLFDELSGIPLLCASMMYGSNFRIGELGKLRIKDLSFERKQIVIRGAKGKKDRIVPFPELVHTAVRNQIESMRVLWRHDCESGLNGVSLPDAFGRKSPKACNEFAWYYLFSADEYSKCPHTGKLFRHHRDMDNVARQIKNAAIRAGLEKRITSHCLRHSYATHSLENGVPIHVVQKLMGHASIETTETYLHVSKKGITSAKSPLETMLEAPKIASEQRNITFESTTLRLFVG